MHTCGFSFSVFIEYRVVFFVLNTVFLVKLVPSHFKIIANNNLFLVSFANRAMRVVHEQSEAQDALVAHVFVVA